VKVFDGLDEFATCAGTELGPGRWLTVDQRRIDTFAEATGDHQWIHVDPVRAAEGPFGATIAHGLLTLSLLPVLLNELYRVDDVSMAINYGLDRVRFMAPVPVDSRVRVTSRIIEVNQLDGAAQGTFETTFHVDGVDKPAAVVVSIVRYLA